MNKGEGGAQPSLRDGIGKMGLHNLVKQRGGNPDGLSKNELIEVSQN